MPTIKDVANAAGVSFATVSYVLNNKTGNVSAETRARVQEVARRLGYRPNGVARSLRRRQTHAIGIYYGYTNIRYVRDAFFGEVLSGIQEGCNTHRKDLLLHNIFHHDNPNDVLEELLDGRIDGLLLIALPTDALIEGLRESRLPAVAIADAVPGIPSVVVADDTGGVMIARHLADRGHRRVLYHQGFVPTVALTRRLDAFLRTAAECGMEVVLSGQTEELTEAETDLLTRTDAGRCTAVACYNDVAAERVLMFAHRHGLRVPEDIAVIGFDGIRFPVLRRHNLTTIHADWVSVAQTAVSLLVDQMNGKAAPAETHLPLELRVGDTT